MQPTGEIHPLAALLPMLSDEELRELADDIASNGLQQPIVLDADGTLIDGRNRLAACRLAGVEPRYVALNGDDPGAFIRSSNLRRNITEGQWAMFEVERRDCPNLGQSRRALAKETGLNSARIGEASIVHQYGHSELCQAVLSRRTPLSVAHKDAQSIKSVKESPDFRLAEIHAVDPDLASRVEAKTMTLEGAIAELQQREKLREQSRWAVAKSMVEIIEAAEALAYTDGHIEKTLAHYDANKIRERIGKPLAAERVIAAGLALQKLGEALSS